VIFAAIVINVCIGMAIFYPLLMKKPVLHDTYQYIGDVAVVDKTANMVVIAKPELRVSVSDTLYVQNGYKLIEIKVVKIYLNAVCEVAHKKNLEMIDEGDAVYVHRPVP